MVINAPIVITEWCFPSHQLDMFTPAPGVTTIQGIKCEDRGMEEWTQDQNAKSGSMESGLGLSSQDTGHNAAQSLGTSLLLRAGLSPSLVHSGSCHIQ